MVREEHAEVIALLNGQLQVDATGVPFDPHAAIRQRQDVRLGNRSRNAALEEPLRGLEDAFVDGGGSPTIPACGQLPQVLQNFPGSW
jgi:hypothetical protein